MVYSQKRYKFFNEIESPERIRAASLLGLDWIRLAPSKWKSATPKASVGDFLIGNRTNYKGLIRADVDHLRAILDSAHAAKIKVVLTFLNLPGHYWKQHNKNVQDRRLWQNKKYWPEAIQCSSPCIIIIFSYPHFDRCIAI